MDVRVSTIAEGIGLITVRAATLASPLAIFLALPPFYNGIWVQVEGAIPWLHGVAALAVLGCAMLVFAGDARAMRALTHPLVLIPAAIFCLAVLLLPASAIPALSIFGAPEHGFGALAYLDLAALTAAAFVTCSESAWRRAALTGVFIAVIGAFVLDRLFRAEHTWAPFFFGDYLAFYAVFMFAILGVLARGRSVWLAAAAALCVVLALLSSSKAAILAIGGAVVLLPLIMRDRSPRLVAALTVGTPIAVGLAVVLVGSAWSEDYREWLLNISGLGPLPALIADSWASMWSRAMLVVVGAQSLADSPVRNLVGFGWGHYNETLLANLPIVEWRLHELIGPSHVYWDAIRRVDFHSHNQYFEALLSGGVLAAVLLLAYGAAWVFSVPERHRRLSLFVAVLLAALQAFWFQMPHTLPVMAVAAAILCDGEFRSLTIPRLRANVVFLAATLTSIALFAAGVMSDVAATNARASLKQIDAIMAGDDPGPLKLRFLAGLNEVYDASLGQHAYALLKEEPSGPGLDVLRTFLSGDAAVSSPRSLKLTISTANTLSGIVFTLPDYVRRFGPQDAAYKESMELVLRRAPRRSDIAIPYFNYLLSSGRETEALDVANLVLAHHENDAVALWFSGIVLLGNPASTAAGMQNLRQSLAFGMRNLMPIDDAVVREIEQ